MSFSFSDVISAIKKVVVPVLRIVSFGLIGTPAGAAVAVATEVVDKAADVATEVKADGDLNHVAEVVPDVVNAVKTVINK